MTVIKDIKRNNLLSLVVIINCVIQGVASNNTNSLNLQLRELKIKWEQFQQEFEM